jgi:GT2 family glycosyltransferase
MISNASGTTLASGASSAVSRLAIGIATTGRAVILARVLGELARQDSPPARIIVCHVRPDDVAGIIDPRVEFLTAPAGLPRQRNAIIDAATDCDILLFLDDDFIPAPGYVAATRAAFDAAADIVGSTGVVIADGASGPGLAWDDGVRRLAADTARSAPASVLPVWAAYGCNMAIRLDAVRRHGLRFDERLPLYGWWEDIDFTRRLAAHGRIVRVTAARGVHLGAKTGRTSGLRLGYSQVVNPLYLARKGSVPWKAAARRVAANVFRNVTRAVAPEPYIDRRGRLRGNLLALRDVLRGDLRPERIIEL